MRAGRQNLDLHHTIKRVIVGLVHDRTIDAYPIAQIADFGDAPRAIVRNAEVADLPLPQEIAERAHGFGERRRVVLFVQVIDIDVIGTEPAQAFLGGLHHPFARQPAAVRPLAHRIGKLGRHHPVVALVADRPADDLLGLTGIVGVCRVDEVDALLARFRHDAARRRLVGRGAERHGADGERRNLHAASPEIPIVHGQSVTFRARLRAPDLAAMYTRLFASAPA